MSERRVWIVQCTCPDGHCILAGGAEADSREDALFLGPWMNGTIARAIKDEAINAWCGICGATHERWHIEVRCTAFRTMDEAAPALSELSRQNAAAHPGPGRVN